VPDPLLRNKLYLPPRRASLVPRPALRARLDQSLQAGCKLALVSAPAGFGKTTLVSEWIASHRHGGPRPDRRGTDASSAVLAPSAAGAKSEDARTASLQAAWLSLDESDNDPVRFWRYVVAALRTLPALEREPIGEAFLAALEASALPAVSAPLAAQPPPDALLASLINALDDALTNRLEASLDGLDVPVVLVLDDLHTVIEQQIHDGLATLLDHLPRQMRLVVCTRADPPWSLARARSRQALVELRARDLRFSANQVAALLNEVYRLDLEAAQIATLNARAEGWAAGLQMAALAMQALAAQASSRDEGVDKAAFVEAFSGSHRLVLDYLVEEVLERQPEEVQAFLLGTSLLERMCAPLCDALLERTDSQALLEQLERDNLFLVPLDDERRWYRYHHLFADLLRRRTETYPARARAVHRAASGWFAEQGLVSEAIAHALAAGDDERAATLIEAQVPGVLARGETGQIRGFLDRLPKPLVRSSPLLCTARAWVLHGYAPPEKVEDWLRQAEAGLESTPTQDRGSLLDADTLSTVRGSIAVLRAFSARTRKAPVETQLALLRHARHVVPEGDLGMRGDVLALLGLCYMDARDEQAAESAFREAYQIGLAGQGDWAALVAVYAQTILARWHGNLERAAALCREALDAMERTARGALLRGRYRADVHILLGRVLLEWNDLDGAERSLAKGLDGRAADGVTEIVLKGRYARARLDLARGRVNDVPALSRLVPTFVDGLVSYAKALEAHVCLMSAARAPYHPQAAIWWQRATDWSAGVALVADDEHWPTVERLVCARVRIAQVRRSSARSADIDLAAVLSFLDAQAALLEARGWVELLVETWIVRAMALSALGQARAAGAALERALQLGAPGGYRRLFLDEGPPMVQLLAQAAERGVGAARALLAEAPGAGAVQALLDPLSARELDVLRLLAGERSQSEIAQALTVSVNTVRSHVKHIYDKLDVHSRHEAIQRARELGLL